MTTIAATDAKNKFGELLEVIHHEPVKISKKGRPIAIVLSIAAYQEMQAKIESSRKKTDFSGILQWVEKHQVGASKETSTEEDYHQHVDEKYGA